MLRLVMNQQIAQSFGLTVESYGSDLVVRFGFS